MFSGIDILIDWTNKNSGFVSVLIFVLTLFIAWLSGVFNAIRKRPKFRIDFIESCTFGTIFDLNKKTKEGLPMHKTAIVIYFNITNIGSAPSSIGTIRVGYKSLGHNFFSKRIWLPEREIREDFQELLSDSSHKKIYPFLKQKNYLIPNHNPEDFLEIGKSISGVSYFEQNESYGNFRPTINQDNDSINLKIEIKDAFENFHYTNIDVFLIDSIEALTYNSYFGQSEKLFPKD